MLYEVITARASITGVTASHDKGWVSILALIDHNIDILPSESPNDILGELI